MKNIWPRQAHTDILPKVLFHFPLICVLVNKGLNLCFYSHWCIFVPLVWLTAFRLPAQHPCNMSFMVSLPSEWINISFFVLNLLPASFFPPPLSYSGAAAPGGWQKRRIRSEMRWVYLFSYAELSYTETIFLFLCHSYKIFHWLLLYKHGYF